METVKIIENKSEIGAAKWGAGMGIDALKTVAKTLQDPFFGPYPNVKIQDENDTLFEETPYRYARRIDKILSLCSRLSNEVAEMMKEGKYFPVVISGDHSPAAGTIAGIRKANPGKRIGVIWIDAHADIHTPYTTPSGNMHGMPLCVSLGIDHKEHQLHDPSKETIEHWEKFKKLGGEGADILPTDLVYIGVRDTEPAEDELMEINNLKNYTVDNFRNMGVDKMGKEITEYLTACDIIYVSFDVDCLDSSISVGTGTPVPGGFWAHEAEKIVKEVLKNPKVCCFEMVEINPTLDNKGNKMAEVAFDILKIAVHQIRRTKGINL